MTDWYINQKIVCVNDNFVGMTFHGEMTPTKNKIYTIRKFHSTAEAFILDEIVNSIHKYVWEGKIEIGELHFLSWRFRPLIEKEADISIFYEILTNLEKEEVLCPNGQESSTSVKIGKKQKKEKLPVEI